MLWPIVALLTDGAPQLRRDYRTSTNVFRHYSNSAYDRPSLSFHVFSKTCSFGGGYRALLSSEVQPQKFYCRCTINTIIQCGIFAKKWYRSGREHKDRSDSDIKLKRYIPVHSGKVKYCCALSQASNFPYFNLSLAFLVLVFLSTIILDTWGIHRGGLTPACGSAHSRSGRVWQVEL